MKRASLEPKKTKNRSYPWLVNLPASLSGTGKRERRYFDSEKVAKAFCKQQRMRLENYGKASTYLPVGKIEEAAAAFDLLNGSGIGLLEAVTQTLERKRKSEQSVTFKTAFEKYIERAEKKKNRSASHVRALRNTRDRLAALRDRLICEIGKTEIEEQLEGMTKSVHNAVCRHVRAVFNFGMRQDPPWCDENPIKKIEMFPLKSRKQILSNEQAGALMKAVCEKETLDLLPYHALTLFAGIRPEETERLTWDNINLTERFVEVPDVSAKGADEYDTRRIVDVEPLLKRWLNFYIKAGGSIEGNIVSDANLVKRLRAVRKAAGIVPWIQDAPRRTYASCWLAVHDDVHKLANLLGHTTPETARKHYLKAVTKKRAREFWKIEPPSMKSKIVPFKAVAA